MNRLGDFLMGVIAGALLGIALTVLLTAPCHHMSGHCMRPNEWRCVAPARR